jgi:hypothetical protein
VRSGSHGPLTTSSLPLTGPLEHEAEYHGATIRPSRRAAQTRKPELGTASSALKRLHLASKLSSSAEKLCC